MDSVTLSISIAAPPQAVLDILGDPLQLPTWAPGFAKSVRRDGDQWIVGNGDREITRHIPVSREVGTVDFLAESGAAHGLFTRVVGNGDGSELTFTFVGDGSDEQRAILAGELATLKTMCEASA
jgi:uncharacterized protein YndB with AHSA1/START domain